MQLFFPIEQYDSSYRGMVFPLLKPFIKDGDFTDAERMQLYGVSEKDFNFTNVLAEADLVLLTMAWNYYEKTHKTEIARKFIEKCALLKKNVLAINAGDFGVKIPKFQNLIVLRSSGYRSQFSAYEHAIPPFINDPLPQYFNSQKVILRQYKTNPTVGFCGQANASPLHAAKEIFKTIIRNLKFYMALTAQEPQQLVSTSNLRATVLHTLMNAAIVDSNFILRKRYRAGVKNKKDKHKTTLEFYENILNSDYIVCVRGAGNFSVRFYETLAMGRIPVFVNTDCALPLKNKIDWKKHVVWVEKNEIDTIAEKVKNFHNALSETDFIDLQHANRRLWKEKLTLNGFFKMFLNEF